MKRPLDKVESDEDPKRNCTDSERDVDEFFALLKRIETTGRQFRGRRGLNNRDALLSSDDNKAVLTSKPAWRPSFEWEDFCATGNGTRDVHNKAAERNSKEGIADEDNNNSVKHRPLSSGQNRTNDEEATESLDLNLPATPLGLQLFI